MKFVKFNLMFKNLETKEYFKLNQIKCIFSFRYRNFYKANPRPDALMKEQIVEMSGLSPRVIRVWFQNKRCKDKKTQIKQEMQKERVSLQSFIFYFALMLSKRKSGFLKHFFDTNYTYLIKDIWILFIRYLCSALF